MRRFSRRLTVLAGATALLVTSACAGDDNDNGGTGAGPEEVVEVTYLTGFGTFGREAYAYVAVELGYFEEEGIEVTIEPGGGTIPNITRTVEGEIDFALADLTGVLLAYGNEQVPLDFTVVAAVLQQTVFSIIALEDSGITSPQDLEGRTLADALGSFGPLLYETYASVAGFDYSEVDTDFSYEPPQLPQLLASGEVDAIGQFLLGQPTIENAAGQPAVVLPFSDVLRDLYGISLVVSNQTAEEDPELVERFTRALMRGLEYTIANPDEAGEILERHIPEGSPAAVAAAEVRLMQPYVQPLTPGAPLGSIDPERVAQSIAILEGAGAIPPGLTPEQVVSFELSPGFEG